jgi:hypothetical protein
MSTAMEAKLKIENRLRAAIRRKAYSSTTEKTYAGWYRRFVRFHHLRHPETMGVPEVEAFLSHLAVNLRVSQSTQNQATPCCFYIGRFSGSNWKESMHNEPVRTDPSLALPCAAPRSGACPPLRLAESRRPQGTAPPAFPARTGTRAPSRVRLRTARLPALPAPAASDRAHPAPARPAAEPFLLMMNKSILALGHSCNGSYPPTPAPRRFASIPANPALTPRKTAPQSNPIRKLALTLPLDRRRPASAALRRCARARRLSHNTTHRPQTPIHKAQKAFY